MKSRQLERSAIPALAAGTCAFVLMLSAHLAEADVFLLKSGGEIRGELVNADEKSPKQYKIRPYSGGEITIQRNLVSRVIDQKPLIEQYEKLKWQHPDTVKGNWEIVRWCREKNLKKEYESHLKRILELDDSEQEAHRLLGHHVVDGVWKSKDSIEVAKGKIKYQGTWRFPEDVELEQRREAVAKQRRDWFTNIKKWDKLLDGNQAEDARQLILQIDDPLAVDALVKRLKGEKNLKRRKLYAKALASLGTRKAVETIVDYSIKDKDEDFRYHCFEMIKLYRPRLSFDLYMATLSSNRSTNTHLNRAAIGLEYLGDKAAVPALIERLITVHRVKIRKGKPGETSATFSQLGTSTTGSGYSTGKPTSRNEPFKNESVLGALVELTGEDYDYDMGRWRAWYSNYKRKNRGPRINPRRDR